MAITVRDRETGESRTGDDLGRLVRGLFGRWAQLESGETVGDGMTVHTVTDSRLAYGGHAVLGTAVVHRDTATG
jgi:hypothetical protein